MSQIKPELVRKKSRKRFDVSSLKKALDVLGTGEWLAVNDEEVGCKDQFSNENINLALICALFVTCMLPLIYTEPPNVGDLSLSPLYANGYLHRHGWHLSSFLISDFYIVCYMTATTYLTLATIICVYFSLAANECGTDARVRVLMHKLGRLTILPYAFFTGGTVIYAIGVMGYFFLTISTIGGMIIFLSVWASAALVFMFVCARNVQGIFAAFDKEDDIPPIDMSIEDVQKVFDKLDSNDTAKTHISEFLVLLRGDEDSEGYRTSLTDRCVCLLFYYT